MVETTKNNHFLKKHSQRKQDTLNTVRRFLCVCHADIQHTINLNGDIITCDSTLTCNRDSHFFEWMSICYFVNKRNKKIQSGFKNLYFFFVWNLWNLRVVQGGWRGWRGWRGWKRWRGWRRRGCIEEEGGGEIRGREIKVRKNLEIYNTKTKQNKNKNKKKRTRRPMEQQAIRAKSQVANSRDSRAYLAEFSKTFHNVRSLLWYNTKTKIYWRCHLIVVSIISITTTTTTKTKNCSVLLLWQRAWWSSHRSGKSM